MSIHKIKFNRRELSGSIADIGIFLPLALGLISVNGLNPFTVFFIGGLLYIAAGLYYGHPMPVQPLKTIAITSLAMGASMNMISMASMLMGVILLLIYFTGISGFLFKIFSRPVVRGIQFGFGLMLIKNGVEYIITKEFLFNGDKIVLSFNGYNIPFGFVVGAASLFYAMKFYNNKNIPVSIVVIGLGFLLGIFTMPDRFLSGTDIKPASLPLLSFPDFNDLLPAFFLLVIPQIPLTLGNALFALSDVSMNYFGKDAKKTTPSALSLGLGAANIIVGMLGGMPLCHGAGGLTAHYRFGSRTVGSNIMIGTIFICIAFFSLYLPVSFLYLIPVSTLGSLLVFTGLSHAMLIRDTLNDKEELFVVLTIGSIAVITGNIPIGCVVGLTANFWIKIALRIEKNI